MQTKKAPLFYGWIIVAAGFSMAAAGIGIFNNAMSVFVRPVTEAMGFSRGAFALYNTVRALTAMVMMPVFGELFGRGRHLKPVMAGCAVMICAAAAGYSVSTELWHFYLFAFLHGVAMNGVFGMAVSTLVNNWFKTKKGFALGLALSGSGLGGSVMVPAVTYVIDSFGWRWGYRAMSLAGFLLLLPVILFVVRPRPADMGLLPYGAEAGGDGAAKADDTYGFTRAEALRMPVFYFAWVGYFFAVFTFNSVNAHAVAYLTDLGHSSLFASSVLSAAMFVLIGGKISMGWVMDRFGVRAGSLTAAAAAVTGCTCLLLAENPLFACLCAPCMGYCMAFGSVSPSMMATRFFGTRDFARLLALLSMADTLANASSQPFPGYIFDVTGSYVPAWYACIGVILLSLTCLLTADRLAKRAWAAREAQA